MFKLLKTVFKAGDVTTKYPFKPYEVDDDFRGKPELNSDQCIVCAACTIACPANALTMRTDPVTGDRTWSLFAWPQTVYRLQRVFIVYRVDYQGI